MPIFIGDVHGDFDVYQHIIKQHKDTIQVGDMGVGFREYKTGWPHENPNHDLMVMQNARYIRGNHDNPDWCATDTQWLPDGYVEGDMMFLGGALSIDKNWRRPGYDWWEHEELPVSQLLTIHELYVETKPNCMVTHCCPSTIAKMIIGTHHKNDCSPTEKALEAMFMAHKPQAWIFGHHHIYFDQIVLGTRFVCVPELEVKEINWVKYDYWKEEK